MLLLSLLLIPENGKIQAAVPCAYGKIHPTCPASGEGDALAAAAGVPIYLYAVPEYLRAYSVIDLSDWGLNVETGGNLRSSERESRPDERAQRFAACQAQTCLLGWWRHVPD